MPMHLFLHYFVIYKEMLFLYLKCSHFFVTFLQVLYTFLYNFFSLFLHTKLQKATESSKLQIKLTRLSRRLQQLRQTISGHLLFLRLVRLRTAYVR